MASAVLQTVDHALHGVERAAIGARTAIGDMAAVAGTAAAGALAYSVDQAMHYQDALVTVQNNAHLTAAEATAMGGAIQQTALGTTSSANQMVQALAPVAGLLERITGHTLNNSDATQVLTAAQDLSEASHIDLTQAVKSISDTLLVYHMNTKQAARVSTDFFQAQAQLGIGTNLLDRMLQRLQPRIAGSGLSIEQLLGIVREMEPAVGSGARAIMYVGNLLQTLQTPAKGAQKVLEALGISVNNAQGQFIGFGPLLGELKSAYDRLPASVAAGSNELTKAALLQSLFGRQANIARALVEGGAAGIAANTKALQANGSSADAAARQTGTLEGQLKVLRATASTAAGAIGLALTPALTAAATWLSHAFEAVTKLAQAHPQLVALVLGLVSALGGLVAITKVLGPLLGGFGATVTGPVLLAAAAVGGFVLLIQRVPGMLAPVQDALAAVGTAIGQVLFPAKLLLLALSHLIDGDGSLGAVTNALEGLGATISRILGTLVQRLADDLVKLAQAFVTWVTPMVPQLLNALGTLAASVLGWIVGTLVPGVVTAVGSLAAAFLDWVGPVIPVLLGDLASLGDALTRWIGQQIPVVILAMGSLAISAIGAFVDTLIAHPERIATAIGLLLGAAMIINVIIAAGATAGAAWAAAMELAATVSDAITGFARSIVTVLARQLGLVITEGTAEGAAFGTAFDAAATGTEAIGGLGGQIAATVGAEGTVISGAGMSAGQVFGGAFAAAAGAVIAVGLGNVLNSIYGKIAGALNITPMPDITKAGYDVYGNKIARTPSTTWTEPGFMKRAGEGVSFIGDTSLAVAGHTRGTIIHRSGALNPVAAAEKDARDQTAAAVEDAKKQVAALMVALGLPKGGGVGAAGAVAAATAPAAAAVTQAHTVGQVEAAKARLAIEQAKAAGLNTSIMSAQQGVVTALSAETVAADKVKVAKEALAAVEAAHYKTTQAREVAVAKAHDALIAAQGTLQVATINVATARAAEAVAINAITAQAQKDATAVSAAQDATVAAQNRLLVAQDRLTAAQDRLTALLGSPKTTAAQLASAQAAVASAQGGVLTATTALQASQTRLANAQDALAKVDKTLSDAGVQAAVKATAPATQAATGTVQRLLGTTTIAVAEPVAPGATLATTNNLALAASGAALVTGDAEMVSWQNQVLALLTQANVTLTGLLSTARGGSTVVQTAGVTGVRPTGISPVSSPSEKTIIDNRIFLDGAEMKQWISRVVAEEERKLAGAAVIGSPW